jgi:hypothetical protein
MLFRILGRSRVRHASWAAAERRIRQIDLADYRSSYEEAEAYPVRTSLPVPDRGGAAAARGLGTMVKTGAAGANTTWRRRAPQEVGVRQR